MPIHTSQTYAESVVEQIKHETVTNIRMKEQRIKGEEKRVDNETERESINKIQRMFQKVSSI